MNTNVHVWWMLWEGSAAHLFPDAGLGLYTGKKMVYSLAHTQIDILLSEAHVMGGINRTRVGRREETFTKGTG
jgi:hypothetical protein